MKKTLWIAMVGALAVSVVAASAQEVLSANAVGYIKKTLPAQGGLVMMSIPLDSMTDTNIVFGRTSVAQEAPQSSTVYFWTEASQTWNSGAKGIKGWAAGQSNRVIAVGESFFLKSPTNAVDPTDVTITGEVPPTDKTVPGAPILSRNVIAQGQLGTLGNPYPVDFIFGQSQVAKDAVQGSVVYFWTEASQTWNSGAKGIKGWAAGQSNRVVAAGEGFFLKASNATSFAWTEPEAPYTWP